MSGPAEFFHLNIQQIIKNLNTREGGLTAREVHERLARFGRNILPQPKEPGLFIIFIQQFLSPLIYILLAAAAVAVFLHEWHDALFIFIVLLINALIGMFQEHSAQKSAQALRKLILIQAKVIREGKNQQINAEELVPGDFVLLESGDKVPADLRFISTHYLEINESLLTGESAAVLKHADAVLPPGTALGDCKNMAFMGTLVTRGRGKGVVVSTGLSTQLGELASSLLFEKEGKPPLLIRMERFTNGISVGVGAAIFILFMIQWWRGVPLKEIFFSSVALAVAAIPEGLPIAITVALAIGMRRMAKRQVIIRKLLAVESLGSCTCIASDKTGTLTMNELSVQRLAFPGEKEWTVSGVGSIPEGEISGPEFTVRQKLLERLCHAVVICNEAELSQNDGQWVSSGDSVDVALLVMAQKAGVHQDHIKKTYLKVGMIPFESEEQFAAFFYQEKSGTAVAVKGALERLLLMCDRMATVSGDVPVDVAMIERQAHKMAHEGFRVLAVASGHTPKEAMNVFDKKSLKHLTFLGLVGMIDPLRPEAKAAVEHCQKAGIRVAMVTGDHPVTALAIARQLNMAADMSQVITGRQLETAQEKGTEAFDQLTKHAGVFARVEPKQKLLLVQSLTRHGHFVAVTGDGANDAPALRSAHVGVAMGKRGTDVARESAQLILADDNFASIVSGIEEGRVAYANVRKVIFLLIATGAAEILLFAMAVFIGLPLPLLPTQLLWLNLVTNGIQDVALAFEPAEGDELKKPPRHPQERIFNPLMIKRIVLSAAVMSIVCFLHYRNLLASGWTIEAARNSVLLLMVLFENVHVINCRSEIKSFLAQNPLRNPFLFFGTFGAQFLHIGAMYTPGLRDVLHIQPVSPGHWIQLFALASLVLVVIEIHKFICASSGRAKILPVLLFFMIFTVLPVCTSSAFQKDNARTANYDPEWGVLVLNSSKKNYRSGRPVNVAMAVLDDKGEMVCDADLQLQVIDQAGQVVKSLSTQDKTIIVNDDCWSKEPNENPDFVTTFSLDKLGYYELRLNASTYNGTKTISEFINIKNKKRFFFERKTATRINPEHMYDVRWDLEVEEHLSGYFVIKIPKDFELIPPEECFEITENNKRKLKCPVNLEPQKGHSIEFKYKAPGKSPWVYEMGPAKLVDEDGSEIYNEGRTWKIAVDPRIRFGAAQEFDADRVAFLRTDVLGTDKFVICYADISAGQCRVGTVSGTTVTFGTEAEFDSDIIIGLASVASTFGVCRLDDDEFVVVYADDSDDDGWAQAATVSGTTITFGTPFEWQNADPEWVSCAGIASDKFVIAFNDEANSDTGTALVCTTSGNTITGCGAENDYAATDYFSQYNAAVKIGTDKFAVSFRSQDAPDDGYFVAGTVSGTTITFGAVNNFTSSPITDVRVCAPQDDDRFVSVYQYTSQLHATAATVSGTVVTAGAETDINSSNQNGESPGCTFISSTEFLTAYEDEANNQFGTAVLCRVDWSTRDIACQPHGQVFAPVQIGSSSVATNSEFRGMETISGYGTLSAKVVISYVEDADGDDGMVIVGNRAPLLGAVTEVD